MTDHQDLIKRLRDNDSTEGISPGEAVLLMYEAADALEREVRHRKLAEERLLTNISDLADQNKVLKEAATHNAQEWSRQSGDMAQEIAEQKAEIERLREALKYMVDDQIDYMTLNKLGDPEKQHTIKVARKALAND